MQPQKIYISPCDETLKFREDQLREWAKLAQPQIHTFTDSPEAADIILVIDTVFTYTQRRSFLFQFLDKCYALEEKPFFAIPGLYTSAPSTVLHKRRLRGWSYFFNRHRRNPFLDAPAQTQNKRYLVSFVGASTAWVRKRLFKLKFDRADILIESTSGKYDNWNDQQPNQEVMQQRYVDIIRQSKFALCPRGVCLGSLRLFEVMELGVAPIIVSDRWLPPPGPDWSRFALFIKESQIKCIPEIAERYASESEERGRLARQAWEEYFSDTVNFNRCLDVIEDLRQDRILALDQIVLWIYPIIWLYQKFKEAAIQEAKSVILSGFRLLKLQFPYQLNRN